MNTFELFNNKKDTELQAKKLKEASWTPDRERRVVLNDGDYVRDKRDGQGGEVFVMRGDPTTGRVHILDKDGRGWTVHPSVLTKVPGGDPAIGDYFPDDTGWPRYGEETEGVEAIDEDPITGAVIGGLLGTALGAKGVHHAGKKSAERNHDVNVSGPRAVGRNIKDFAQGMFDPRTYIPKKKGMGEAYKPNRKYPDSKEGIIQFFSPQAGEVDQRWVKEAGFPQQCKIHPDPSVEGVWAVDSVKNGSRTIVYLAGYKDPWGEPREGNDFETGGLPFSEMKRMANYGNLTLDQIKFWRKCASIDDREFKILSTMLSGEAWEDGTLKDDVDHEAGVGIDEVKVNYDDWRTPPHKTVTNKLLAILKLMSDGQPRYRASMLRDADIDPNPMSPEGFGGFEKADYSLYKMGLLKVVKVDKGQKVFKITPKGMNALKTAEAKLKQESITVPGSEYTGPKSPAEEVSQREQKAKKDAEAKKYWGKSFGEGATGAPQKFRIAVTVTDPGATAVTQRDKKILKYIRVTTTSPQEAENKAIQFYKRQGYKVLDAANATQQVTEKSVSKKQARTMAAAAHDPKFAEKVGIKQSVAKDFNKADTGTKQLSQAMKEDNLTELAAKRYAVVNPETNERVYTTDDEESAKSVASKKGFVVRTIVSKKDLPKDAIPIKQVKEDPVTAGIKEDGGRIVYDNNGNRKEISAKDDAARIRANLEKYKKLKDVSGYVTPGAPNLKLVHPIKEDDGATTQEIANAIARRLNHQYPTIFDEYGDEVVGDAIMDVAQFHEGAQELGSSDISIMAREVIAQVQKYNAESKVTEGGANQKIDKNDPEDMKIMSDDIASTLRTEFGGKAWLNGGSYSYLMDVKKPKLMVASDGSRVRIKNFADGIEGWADRWVWDDMANSYPDGYGRFFRPAKSIRGQEDHETLGIQGESAATGDFVSGDKVVVTKDFGGWGQGRMAHDASFQKGDRFIVSTVKGDQVWVQLDSGEKLGTPIPSSYLTSDATSFTEDEDESVMESRLYKMRKAGYEIE